MQHEDLLVRDWAIKTTLPRIKPDMGWGHHTLIVNLQHNNSPSPQTVLVLKVWFLVGKASCVQGNGKPDELNSDHLIQLNKQAASRILPISGMRSYAKALLWPLQDAWCNFMACLNLCSLQWDPALFHPHSGAYFHCPFPAFPSCLIHF